MRTSLLAALLLQLLIQVKVSSAVGSEEYKYGDIIGFQREKLPGTVIKYKFMHFGIYIDKLRFEEFGQKEGDDLFHITGPIIENHAITKLSDCVFGQIKKEIKTTVERHNYLDGIADQFKKVRFSTDENVITERILCKLHNCQQWSAFHDNCEHLATYIRYGVPISLQRDQKKEGQCHNKRHGLTEEEEQRIINQLKGSENQMNADNAEAQIYL